MTMTQRFAGALRRQGGEWDKRDMPVQAEMVRQAARHVEELQQAHDAIARPWKPMRSAPKDGTAVLVLLEGSDIPHAVRWSINQWMITWDGHWLHPTDGPRYWMAIPIDPDADDETTTSEGER